MISIFKNVFFINGNAYAGKSTMVKLLAKKYDGIACEENYHDALLESLNKEEFPCLTYTRDLEDFHEFIRRSPQEYEAWIDGVSKECEILELQLLDDLVKNNPDKKIFVDTNISLETLRNIADPQHVLIMLADPEISVRRFFERPDKEKQFLYQLIMDEPDPDKAMENYREGLTRINSQERYDKMYNSGFNVILRDENRSIEQTLELVEKTMGLDIKELEILGDNRFDSFTKTREGSRGIVVKDGMILLTHETKSGWWIVPGGGLEEGETYEECCIREVEEETGYIVEVIKPFLHIYEYYEEYRYGNCYFICKVVGQGNMNPTDHELRRGIEPEWIPLQEAVDIFSKHQSYAETCEEQRGSYLREYTALSEYIK
ncbi:MAG: NUDIX domain-containing protein [Erysipelotrichaceae bacterium]|nr:NUDIX domain-containing protein [Erysipelotrichaceae bacterium]